MQFLCVPYLTTNKKQSRNTITGQRSVETPAHLACYVFSDVLPQQRLDILKSQEKAEKSKGRDRRN